MTLSTDLSRSIQNVLAAQAQRPPRTPGRSIPPAPYQGDPPRELYWAVREIVDNAMFETIR